MRFLALVSCCRASVQPPPPRRREEARALVPLPCTEGDMCRSAKRGRRGSLAWRPSLVAISEDSVASGGPTRAGDRTVGSRKGLAGENSSSSSRDKIRLWDDSERFGFLHSGGGGSGQNPTPLPEPALIATPHVA